MGLKLNERKEGKYADISNHYKASLSGPITVTYAPGKHIDLAGNSTISDFNAVLIATRVDNVGLPHDELLNLEVRIRDMYKELHFVTYAQLELIIGLGCSAGNTLWNKKVDLQEECNAIKAADYPSEQDAIDAVSAIVW